MDLLSPRPLQRPAAAEAPIEYARLQMCASTVRRPAIAHSAGDNIRLSPPPGEASTTISADNTTGAAADSAYCRELLELPVHAQALIFDGFPVAGRIAFYRRFALDMAQRCADPATATQARADFLAYAQAPTGAFLMRTDQEVRRLICSSVLEKTTTPLSREEALQAQPFPKNIALFIAREIKRGTFDNGPLGHLLVNFAGRLPDFPTDIKEQILGICIERLRMVTSDQFNPAYNYFHQLSGVKESPELITKLVKHIPLIRSMLRSDTEHRLYALDDLHRSPNINAAGFAAMYDTYDRIWAASRVAQSNSGRARRSLLMWQVANNFYVDKRANEASRTIFFLRQMINV